MMAQTNCHRVLTVGNEAQGGILDALQRRVDLEHVSNVLGALHVEIIARDAANEGMITTSAVSGY